MPNDTAAPRALPTNSLVVRFAQRFGVDPEKMVSTLKATAFAPGKGEPDVTNEQMMSLLVVADQYKLNPFTREIYAFADPRRGIVPIVGVDGWSRIVNEDERFDGMEFVDGPSKDGGPPDWIECVIYRKDRAHPTRVREYFAECKRGTGPWGSHPRRMLRHKAFMQCGRLAFGFVGIYDEDEAERIIEGQHSIVVDHGPRVEPVRALKDRIRETQAPKDPPANDVIDIGDAPEAKKDEPAPVVEKAEQKAPPSVSTGGPAPTYVQVHDLINAAKDKEALDLARDQIRFVAHEQHRAELDVEAMAKLKTFK